MRKIPCHNLFKRPHPIDVLGIVHVCVCMCVLGFEEVNANSSLFGKAKWVFV